MITRDSRSSTFIVQCDTCGCRTHARGVNGFDVARQAQAAGWTIALHDRCRDCPSPAVGARASTRRR